MSHGEGRGPEIGQKVSRIIWPQMQVVMRLHLNENVSDLSIRDVLVPRGSFIATPVHLIDPEMTSSTSNVEFSTTSAESVRRRTFELIEYVSTPHHPSNLPSNTLNVPNDSVL